MAVPKSFSGDFADVVVLKKLFGRDDEHLPEYLPDYTDIREP
jgi:hypothetical protein